MVSDSHAAKKRLPPSQAPLMLTWCDDFKAARITGNPPKGKQMKICRYRQRSFHKYYDDAYTDGRDNIHDWYHLTNTNTTAFQNHTKLQNQECLRFWFHKWQRVVLFVKAYLQWKQLIRICWWSKISNPTCGIWRWLFFFDSTRWWRSDWQSVHESLMNQRSQS